MSWYLKEIKQLTDNLRSEFMYSFYLIQNLN